MNDDDETRGWPVDDLYGFLEGSWSLYRTMNDLRLNMPGVLQGDVHIGPGDGDELIYHEHGELILGDRRETIDRRYRYTFPNRRTARHLGEVHFDDGGLFHALDLSTGYQKVTHHDTDDTYRGTFTVDNADVWFVNWFITGPSKEIISDSRYQRLAP